MNQFSSCRDRALDGFCSGGSFASFCVPTLCVGKTRCLFLDTSDSAPLFRYLILSSLGKLLVRTKAHPHNASVSNPLVHGPGLCSSLIMRGT